MNIRSMKPKFGAAALLALVTANPLITTNVIAQSSSNASNILEEIVITARKREETLLDAPLAVSVFGQAELEQGGFDDIIDISKATPGLFIEANNQAFARVNTTPRFRGIFLSTGNRLQQTATVFLDGIYMSGGIQTLGINELERVEIIKGPQSAMFGRNTFAGAINYVSKDPSDEFRADIDITAATRDEYRLAGGIEGSLIDDVLTGRLGVMFDNNGGHYDNVAVPGQQLGEEEQWSINGTLVLTPSENARIRLRAAYREVDDGPPAAQRTLGFTDHNFGGFLVDANGSPTTLDGVPSVLVPSDRFTLDVDGDDIDDFVRTESVYRGTITSPTTNIGLNSGFDTVQALRTRYINDSRAPNTEHLEYSWLNTDEFGLQLESTRISLHADFDITENISLALLTGYNDEAYGYWLDFDLGADFSYTGFSSAEIEDKSFEARLSGVSFNDKLNWAVGASVVDIDIAEQSLTSSDFGFLTIFGGAFDDATRTGARTTGFFTSLDYQFTDQFSASLELRSQEDEISEPAVNDGLPAPISPAAIDSTLPRLTLRYQPNDNSTFYVTYSEGNLPGGFNPEVGELTASQLTELLSKAPGASTTFGEETLENLEFGWKQSSLDGRLAFNLALFMMERGDEIFRTIETVTSIPSNPAPQRTVAFNENGATTDIKGLELDGTWVVNDSFTLRGSVAYIDSAIASFPAGKGTGDFGDLNGGAANVAGQEAPRFPPLSFSLTGVYERPFSGFPGFDTWYTRGDVYYTGNYWDSNSNVAEVDTALDTNIRAGIRGDKIGLELFITNLFDEDAPAAANNFADLSFSVRTQPGGLFDFTREGTQVSLRDKRQVGIRMNYSF